MPASTRSCCHHLTFKSRSHFISYTKAASVSCSKPSSCVCKALPIHHNGVCRSTDVHYRQLQKTGSSVESHESHEILHERSGAQNASPTQQDSDSGRPALPTLALCIQLCHCSGFLVRAASNDEHHYQLHCIQRSVPSALLSLFQLLTSLMPAVCMKELHARKIFAGRKAQERALINHTFGIFAGAFPFCE